MNSAKQAGHLFFPQSSLVIVYANGMYGMLASAHNDSQMLLRNIRESTRSSSLRLTVRLFSSDAFFYVRIRTECSEHVNSFIDAY